MCASQIVPRELALKTVFFSSTHRCVLFWKKSAHSVAFSAFRLGLEEEAQFSDIRLSPVRLVSPNHTQNWSISWFVVKNVSYNFSYHKIYFIEYDLMRPERVSKAKLPESDFQFFDKNWVLTFFAIPPCPHTHSFSSSNSWASAGCQQCMLAAQWSDQYSEYALTHGV